MRWRCMMWHFYLFSTVSPLSGRVPMRPTKGLEMSAGTIQPSLSGRSLSCSLDELGLKYLNHRGKKGQTVSHQSQVIPLFKTSTNVPRARRKSGYLGTSQQSSSIDFHLQSYICSQMLLIDNATAPLPPYCTVSIISTWLSADFRLTTLVGFLHLPSNHRGWGMHIFVFTCVYSPVGRGSGDTAQEYKQH